MGGRVRLLGVRHHSPACARLVAAAIEELRPAYVLVEGPADMNGRLDELLLGHELPVAVFSHYRHAGRSATSWTPLCAYSPEWVALTAGRAAGAQVAFIDLPAWHPAFAERANRYADAELRYARATERLCERFAVDSVDALWDRLFEVEPADGLWERLDAYFDLVRGDAQAEPGDTAREAYMASWVRAAARAAGDRPVLVVTGGFHTPALRGLTGSDAEAGAGQEWPEVPLPEPDAVADSYLVPYSYRQLDAFAGYQSGMPSPGYYEQVWERGPQEAADTLVRAVAGRLRARRHPVSTADLVAARALTRGLALLRGHSRPARTDVLDGLAGALITDDLAGPLPWTGRGGLAAGTHPVVVEMVAACSGDRVGRLHPDTPAPPLVHEVAALLADAGIRTGRPLTLDLGDGRDLERSRLLHRLRVLGVPGHERTAGPAHGADPVFTERWEPGERAGRDAALVEAGSYGARLDEAAAAVLAERAGDAGREGLAAALFDAVLCGAASVSDRLLAELATGVGKVKEPGALGEVLATALGLWRHDRVFGVARGPLLGALVGEAVLRGLWLLEGLRGGPGVDFGRLRAVVALRDACVHAPEAVPVPREAVADAARRVSRDAEAPADLRGAAFALCRTLVREERGARQERQERQEGEKEAGGSSRSASSRTGPGSARDGRSLPRAAADEVLALAGSGEQLGDWLAGLFAVARDQVSRARGPADDALVGVLDSLVGAMSDEEFLVALPSLRQAFAFFPPREREHIARQLLERRRLRGSARSLLRTSTDPLVVAEGRALEKSVDDLLARYGLDTASPGAEHTQRPQDEVRR
ncbi:DUF5682 family protein [Streptomyces cremeus]|uniref:DUF5682 family protein n=1 Tax=Streptomyces cremeus TaxID=66881 RepID=A0ABV5PLM2_STRCM